MLLEARRLIMWKKFSRERLREGFSVSIPI
jgi:hypothetical protein